MNQLRVVDEKHKRRRRRLGLRRVQNLQPLPLPRRRFALAQDRAQPAIELWRGNPAAPFLNNLEGDLERLRDPLPGLRRHIRDRCPGRKSQGLLDLLAPDLLLLFLRRQEIPLVQHQHEPAAGLGDIPRDMRVLGRQSLPGIDDNDPDIRAFHGAQPAQEGVLLHTPGQAGAPNAGGIDQQHTLALKRHRRVDRVARRSGHRRHEASRVSDQRIDQ